MLMFTADPVETGVIDSFGKPGANITGLYGRVSESVGKRLQLLTEIIPTLSRVGVLYNDTNPILPDLQRAARELGVQLVPITLKGQPGTRYAAAFDLAHRERVGALMADAIAYARRKEFAQLALQRRVPTINTFLQYTEAGGLASYGPDNEAVFARSAYFVDRLLKGVSAGELPVEQMASFKFALNLKTAKALGITIPESILLRADEVIR